MRLTTYSDYALRVLMYLALKSERLSTIAEIAESYDISEAHLMKVVHQLGVAGYIETVRGRGGGLRLAKPVEFEFESVAHFAGGAKVTGLSKCFQSAGGGDGVRIGKVADRAAKCMCGAS